MSPRNGDLGLGARFPRTQARGERRGHRRSAGDHGCGALSCGSIGVGGSPFRCLPGRPNDGGRAQLGVWNRPTLSGVLVRGRGFRGRTFVAYWTVYVPFGVPISQSVGRSGPVDTPQRGVGGTRGGRPWHHAAHGPAHPLEIGERGAVLGASALLQSPRTVLAGPGSTYSGTTHCAGARLSQLRALATSI